MGHPPRKGRVPGIQKAALGPKASSSKNSSAAGPLRCQLTSVNSFIHKARIKVRVLGFHLSTLSHRVEDHHFCTYNFSPHKLRSGYIYVDTLPTQTIR